ncbi:MAG: hypothetical protein JXA50_08020 [Deltaproteobacteria bacterium]|nr:hypothetical protein [Deltaproteobacteria bacterium]
MFELFYESHFREIFGSEPEPANGLGEEAVQARLAQRGLQIPRALFDYYSVAGYHWVNKKQNRLRSIEELDWYMDWLVFMDDDQGLVSWGIQRQDLSSSDPLVWQGILGEEIDWFQEDLTLSEFLIEMCREAV